MWHLEEDEGESRSGGSVMSAVGVRLRRHVVQLFGMHSSVTGHSWWRMAFICTLMRNKVDLCSRLVNLHIQESNKHEVATDENGFVSSIDFFFFHFTTSRECNSRHPPYLVWFTSLLLPQTGITVCFLWENKTHHEETVNVSRPVSTVTTPVGYATTILPSCFILTFDLASFMNTPLSEPGWTSDRLSSAGVKAKVQHLFST